LTIDNEKTVTRAKVKWFGIGTFAYPYLWKINQPDTKYQQIWDEPQKPPPKTEQKPKPPKNIKKNREKII